MKMKVYGLGAILIIGLLWLGGCYPSTGKITEELDVVVTQYNEEENFQRFTTYYIEDTVLQIGDSEASDYIPLDLSREDMDRIVGQVRTNMEAYGYTAITDPTTAVPDVGIFIEVIAQRRTVIYTYPGYGWGWGGFGGHTGSIAGNSHTRGRSSRCIDLLRKSRLGGELRYPDTIRCEGEEPW